MFEFVLDIGFAGFLVFLELLILSFFFESVLEKDLLKVLVATVINWGLTLLIFL